MIKKILILFSILILFVSLIESTCLVQPIQVKLGDSCSEAMMTYCELDTFCSSVGICERTVLPGDACLRDEQCYPYGCINGTCNPYRFAQVGDVCGRNSDCVGTQVNCTNGICANFNNSYCLTNYDCAFTQYCNVYITNTCMDSLALGDVCTGVNQCPPGYVCTVNSQNSSLTCQEPFQGQEGDSCSGLYTRQFLNDCDIAQSLNCDTTTKQCTKKTGELLSTCESCNTASTTETCGFGSNCVCSTSDINGSGNGTCSQNTFATQGNIDSMNDMYECFRNNSCIFDFNYLSELTCFHVKCKRQVCTSMGYFEPYLLFPDFTHMALQSCMVDPVNDYCSDTTPTPTETISSSSQVVAMTLLLIISLLISIIL